MSQVKTQSSSAPPTTAPKPATNLDDAARTTPPEEPYSAAPPLLDGYENRSSCSPEAYKNETPQLIITGSPPHGPGSEPDGFLDPNSWEPKVIVSASDQHAAYEHDIQLRDTLVRHLQWCEQQKAVFGMHATFEMVEDLRQTQEALVEIEARLAQYPSDIATRADRKAILSTEKQREAVLALSRITGIPPDQIKLVDIVLGSVVLIVDMPIAGAARLVAMQRLNHPMLRAQGFANVALDQIVDTQGHPLDSLFERAVRFAQSDLTASTPPSHEASPYTSVDAAARLRITLTDDAARQG